MQCNSYPCAGQGSRAKRGRLSGESGPRRVLRPGHNRFDMDCRHFHGAESAAKVTGALEMCLRMTSTSEAAVDSRDRNAHGTGRKMYRSISKQVNSHLDPRAAGHDQHQDVNMRFMFGVQQRRRRDQGQKGRVGD
jgi:hypothetical protein